MSVAHRHFNKKQNLCSKIGKQKTTYNYSPAGQHFLPGLLWRSSICRDRSRTPAPLVHSDPGLLGGSYPNAPLSASCSKTYEQRWVRHVEMLKGKRKSRMCGTHRDLLGVRRSYSTWCLSGMSGRMASNRGRRFGSLMTSFRSPTSTGRSMDLGEQKGHILTLQSLMRFRRLHCCSF